MTETPIFRGYLGEGDPSKAYREMFRTSLRESRRESDLNFLVCGSQEELLSFWTEVEGILGSLADQIGVTSINFAESMFLSLRSTLKDLNAGQIMAKTFGKPKNDLGGAVETAVGLARTETTHGRIAQEVAPISFAEMQNSVREWLEIVRGVLKLRLEQIDEEMKGVGRIIPVFKSDSLGLVKEVISFNEDRSARRIELGGEKKVTLSLLKKMNGIGAQGHIAFLRWFNTHLSGSIKPSIASA